MTLQKIRGMTAMTAGLLIAGTAWALNTQLGEMLPYLDCRNQTRWSAVVSFLGLAAACLSGAISWRWARQARLAAPLTAVSTFMASMSALAAVVFAFALSMQGIASLVLSGCER